jgi:ATP-binding cassette subfamily F protein 3
MKMLAKMEELAPIHAAAAFQFEFREPDRAPNPLLVLEDVVAGYHTDEGDKPILRDINLNLQAGQRIGLLGVNGAGKSTLIKTIAAELAPLTGDAHWGKGLPRRLQLPRHHGQQPDCAVLWRRKGASGTGADRLAEAQLASAG